MRPRGGRGKNDAPEKVDEEEHEEDWWRKTARTATGLPGK
jgi:hypothetical protein